MIEAGTPLICIDNSQSNLILGQIYIFERIYLGDFKLKDITGSWFSWRFIIAKNLSSLERVIYGIKESIQS